MRALPISFSLLGLTLASGCCTVELAQPIDPPSTVLESVAEDAQGDPLIDNGYPVPPDWWILFQEILNLPLL